MMLIAMIVGYMVCAGVTFVVTASVCGIKDSPWDDPGPFFAGVGWPIAMPFVIATMWCKRGANKTKKNEQKRKEEVAEAEHNLKMARLRKQEADTLDLQLNAALSREQAQA